MNRITHTQPQKHIHRVYLTRLKPNSMTNIIFFFHFKELLVQVSYGQTWVSRSAQ